MRAAVMYVPGVPCVGLFQPADWIYEARQLCGGVERQYKKDARSWDGCREAMLEGGCRRDVWCAGYVINWMSLKVSMQT